MHRTSASSRHIAAIGGDIGGAGLVHAVARDHELRGLRGAGLMRRVVARGRRRHLSRRWKRKQQSRSGAYRLDTHETFTSERFHHRTTPRRPGVNSTSLQGKRDSGGLTDDIEFPICSLYCAHGFRAIEDVYVNMIRTGTEEG
jgi:hypothetical protein